MCGVGDFDDLAHALPSADEDGVVAAQTNLRERLSRCGTEADIEGGEEGFIPGRHERPVEAGGDAEAGEGRDVLGAAEVERACAARGFDGCGERPAGEE